MGPAEFSAYSLFLQVFGLVTFPMTETGPVSLAFAFSSPTTQTSVSAQAEQCATLPGGALLTC